MRLKFYLPFALSQTRLIVELRHSFANPLRESLRETGTNWLPNRSVQNHVEKFGGIFALQRAKSFLPANENLVYDRRLNDHFREEFESNNMNTRFSSFQRFLFPLVLFIAFALVLTFASAPACGQGKEIRELKTAVKKAQQMLKDGKEKELVQYIPVFQEKFSTLAKAGPNVVKNLESTYDDFKEIYSKLELAGYDLPAWQEMGGDEPAEGDVGFVKDVSPIIVAKCGRCHVDRASGRVSLRSYTEIMAAQDGLTIFPGKSAESQMIDVIESGEMPKGGLKVTDEEMATLKKMD